MKVTIKLINPKSYNPTTKVISRDTRVVEGICKSEPAHPMDTTRLIYTSFWDVGKSFEKCLEDFKNMLKNRIYKEDSLQIEVIDSRETNLPHRDMY